MSSLLKKLRRWLRRYRGLAIGCLIVLFLGTVYYSIQLMTSEHPDSLLEQSSDSNLVEVMANQPYKLTLQTKYLCGLETEVKNFESMQQLENWLAENKHTWTIKDKKEREVSAYRDIDDDLSPLCKEEGYFGITEEGILTIFQGPPGYNQIIETFFRIDTKALESRLPKEEISILKQGIRIHNVAEYMSILSTYGEFAVEY